MNLKRIPFDSLTLMAVCREFQSVVGSRVQRVVKLDDSTIALNTHGMGKTLWILICVHPDFARIHFMESKPESAITADDFVRLLRSHVEGARIKNCQIEGLDRILKIQLERSDEPPVLLVAEIMGKHSNLILVSSEKKILACAKPVGATKSSRVVLVGRKFEPPPHAKRESMLKANSWEELKGSEGASPFLIRLLESVSSGEWNLGKATLQGWVTSVKMGTVQPVFDSEFGAYPIDVAALGYCTEPISSVSTGLDRFYKEAATQSSVEQKRRALLGSLDRVVLSRSAAIHDLNEVLASGLHAGKWQMYGELLLAYGSQITSSASVLKVQDYSYTDVEIPIDPELDPIENANRYFSKAKKSKSNLATRNKQFELLTAELTEINSLVLKVNACTSLSELEDFSAIARTRKWLHVVRVQSESGGKATDDPFQGHRIRKLEAPGGLRVLYGENATSNDFLTLRVAKPNDIWLHVRGGNSAHVVIQTGNAPERVGKAIIEFAAGVAVRNSPSKHSGYVSVDYTLRKYVRKPKGAPIGTALYTHEKTINIQS